MKQLDIISEVLNAFADLSPSLSKQLTSQVAHIKDGRERKRRKIELILESHRAQFELIARKLYPEAVDASNPLGYSSHTLFTTIHQLLKHERESGSFGSKYDFGQGAIE